MLATSLKFPFSGNVTELLWLFSLRYEAIPGNGGWCKISCVSHAELLDGMSSKKLMLVMGDCYECYWKDIYDAAEAAALPRRDAQWVITAGTAS